MRKEDVRGRWRVVSWEQVYDDGRIVHPMGEKLEGFLHYDEDRVYILITAADRPPFRTGGQWNAANVEKASAYDTCLCYAGRYEVLDEHIVHHVDVSLFPNWVGGSQRRRAELVDGRLTLSGRLEVGTAEARTVRLTWERD